MFAAKINPSPYDANNPLIFLQRPVTYETPSARLPWGTPVSKASQARVTRTKPWPTPDPEKENPMHVAKPPGRQARPRSAFEADKLQHPQGPPYHACTLRRIGPRTPPGMP